MTLRGMAQYTLLSMGLGEIFDSKMVKLVLHDYSGL